MTMIYEMQKLKQTIMGKLFCCRQSEQAKQVAEYEQNLVDVDFGRDLGL